MIYLNIGLAFVKAVAKFFSWLESRSLIEAGQAQAILNGLNIAEEEINNAMQARQKFRDDRAAGRIGDDDDDGFRRD